MLPRHARFVLSRLRCNGQSLLLSYYLFSIGKIENRSCIACGHPSQDTSHPVLHCPATDSLRRSLLATLCLSTTCGAGLRAAQLLKLKRFFVTLVSSLVSVRHSLLSNPSLWNHESSYSACDHPFRYTLSFRTLQLWTLCTARSSSTSFLFTTLV